MVVSGDNISIKIKNCNSIDQAIIQIVRGGLNIKYGPNGLGKSTIAKAIVGQIRQDGSLDTLIQFKNRKQSKDHKPTVEGITDFKSVLIFDEAYVNQFVFQQDEVIKNSFEIFIKNKEYLDSIAEVELLLEGIKKSFAANQEIEQTIKDLKELREAFGTSKTGAIPKNSKIHKAYGSGNKIENIPDSLKPFETFIRSERPSKWISWQIQGNDFLKLGDNCPYCSKTVSEGVERDVVLSVEKEYDAKSIDHLNHLNSIIERLGKYFSDKCKENLNKVTKSKIEITSQEQSFLSGLKADLDALIEKLEGLRTISFFSLQNVENIEERIAKLTIDLQLIDKLDSEETRKVVDPINSELQQLNEKTKILKGKINTLKTRVGKIIKENEKGINDFLKSAGYKYSVTIISEPDSYKMKLLHEDLDEHIEGATKHLSYGERNAFALILFMHQALSENHDLVILDDPISSFDKNKKFAILHELFQGKATLRGRTTIMLTHDIEPAIDIIKSTARVFQGSSPSATFLTYKGGNITETTIQREDIQTFAKICKDNINKLTDTLVKAVYLRRHYEILDDMGIEYNLLASIFKKRDIPTIQSSHQNRDINDQEKKCAEEEIRKYIPEFKYDELVNQVKDSAIMKEKFTSTQVGYEKIQLFRIIKGQHENDVITKFINESYHIENEYVMQLNPHKFEGIPEYVINECCKLLV